MRQSNFSAARTSPIVPSWIRSRNGRPWFRYRFAIETTSRRFASTIACFAPLTADKEFADHNRQLMAGWMTKWVPQALEAARTMQPLWSAADHKPPRFEDSLDRAKNRFAGICRDLGLDTPEELKQ